MEVRVAETVFWCSLAVVFYVYVGYPLLLLAWRRARARSVEKGVWEPTVSLIIAAGNESRHIEGKILNCLALDYPSEKLQLIVSLDAPTDGTDRVVTKYAARGVDVVQAPEHEGKAAALNRAARQARGEVLLFLDARQRLEPTAVRRLVENLRDKRIGVVSGTLILMNRSGKEARDGVGLYWRYERWLRSMESEIHSILGATGAIYAIRGEDWQNIPEGTILDDVLVPMRIVTSGRRAVIEPRARVYDPLCNTPEAEYRRKVRTLLGNYQLLSLMPSLLAPWRNPVFIQFASHKLGRLLAPYFLAALLLSNAFLQQGLYGICFLFQGAWYSLALAGGLVSLLKRAPAELKEALLLPYTFLVMNWAAVAALYHFVCGNEETLRQIWVSSQPATPELQPVQAAVSSQATGKNP